MIVSKLKELFPDIDVSGNFYVRLTDNEKVKQKFYINRKQGFISINLHALDAREKKKLKNYILNCFDKDSIEIIDGQDSEELLERLYNYKDKDNDRILTFYKPILSKRDYECLRDSLFLREEFKAGRIVSVLKTDIQKAYGERGNVISNLCTAGYFEHPMVDLYNKTHSHEEFWRYWDVAVEKACTALFVSSSMNIDTIKEEIHRRLQSAKDYGMKYIHVHGIGKENIKKINEFMKRQAKNFSFTIKNVFSDQNNDNDASILVIEVIFK